MDTSNFSRLKNLTIPDIIQTLNTLAIEKRKRKISRGYVLILVIFRIRKCLFRYDLFVERRIGFKLNLPKGIAGKFPD